MSRELVIWTIYDHPKDFPNCFVARKYLNATPTGEVIVSQKLDDIRSILSSVYGLVVLSRDENDDPVIVETWL